MLAPGWRDRTTATPGLPLTRPALRRSSTEFDDFGDVREPDRRAVAVGDHQIAILRCVGRLVVGVDLIVVVVVLDRALWAVGVGRSQRGADVLEPDAVVEDRAGVDLDPHRRQRGAGDVDLADARKLRQPLLQNVGGEVVELSRRVGRRRHGDDHDRRIGGIDLMIGGVLAQAGRQIDPRRDDGGLDVARRAIDIAIKAELKRDAGRAERALRRHLVDVGDLTQVPLERRRDRGRHGVGACAWHIRLNRDDRKVDLRQRRNRQLRIAQEAAEHDSDREQNRGDGTANEELGKPVVHGVSVASVAAGVGGAHAETLAQSLEEEIDDRGRIEGQHLAEGETADNRQPQRTAKLRADAGSQHQGQRAEDRRDRRHQNRPQAQETGLIDRFTRRQSLLALRVEREVDHHDRVLLDDADQGARCRSRR